MILKCNNVEINLVYLIGGWLLLMFIDPLEIFYQEQNTVTDNTRQTRNNWNWTSCEKLSVQSDWLLSLVESFSQTSCSFERKYFYRKTFFFERKIILHLHSHYSIFKFLSSWNLSDWHELKIVFCQQSWSRDTPEWKGWPI